MSYSTIRQLQTASDAGVTLTTADVLAICDVDGNKTVKIGAFELAELAGVDFRDFKGATNLDDGTAGLVPAPQRNEDDEFLRGDGSFAFVPYPLDFKGATDVLAGTAGLVPRPTAGEEDEFLCGNGNWETPPYPLVYAGATATNAGTSGLVKAPAVGDQNKFLRGNGNWDDPFYPVIFDATPGLAPASDGSATKYLRADGSYVVPPYPGNVSTSAAGLAPALPSSGGTTKWLRADATWVAPPYPGTATTSATGLVKIGAGLSVTSAGVLSVSDSGPTFTYDSNTKCLTITNS
jgi:hypothetical protein